MKWFKNLSLRNKIGSALGLISFFILIMVLYSYIYLSGLREQQNEINVKYINERLELEKINNEVDNFRLHLFAAMQLNHSSIADSIEGDYNDLRVLRSSAFNSLTQYNPAGKYNFTNLGTMLDNYLKITGEHMSKLRTKGAALDEIIKEQNMSANIITATIASLSQNIQGDINEITQSSTQTTFRVIILILLAAIVFFSATVMILLQSNKWVSDPLNKLADASQKIAAGDTSVTIDVLDRSDEVGKLYSAFNQMINSLSEISIVTESISKGNLTVQITPRSNQDRTVNSLNIMTNNLRKIISDSITSIGVINHVSGNIFSAAARLSTSANQTATAIGETTVTIEEVKRTSEVLSKKAKEISIIAQKASEISELGLKSTEDTMQGIHNIGGQMATIGESALKLSEHSRAIGDIITSVNDLAEQSNLLAVNAAIEAARAGEHGKSFVIVAQEIKNLAQQSKQATAQVKSALSDIQNSINSTVMATEQGEKIVVAGVKLSEQTRTSISQLSQTISLFTDISMQTSVSSQEQFVGMDQVAIAMDNIKVASSQNALTTKELEQLARNLQDISQKLNEIRNLFVV